MNTMKTMKTMIKKLELISLTLITFMTFMTLFVTNVIAIKDPSLALYFSFDEGAGDKAADKSGNNHVGVLRNGVMWTKDGKHGGALLFNNPSHYVEVPASAKLDMTKEITLEAWIFPYNAPPASCGLLEKRTGANTGGYAMLWTSGKVETWIWVDKWAGTNGDQKMIPKVNEWHHIAGVYDGTSIKQYVDGELDSKVTLKGDINIVAAEVFRIGRAQIGTPPMPGIIDEVAVYSRALSDKEIEKDIKDGILPLKAALSVNNLGKLAVAWGSIKKSR